MLTLVLADSDPDSENESENRVFEDDAERKDPDADGVAVAVAFALNDALLVLNAHMARRRFDSLPDAAADVVHTATIQNKVVKGNRSNPIVFSIRSAKY